MEKENKKLRKQIKQRDGYSCLCCSKIGKDKDFDIDHIVSKFQGGDELDPMNLQTLCKECNMQKGVNSIDFRLNKSPLISQKKLILYGAAEHENRLCALNRTINFFYHCHAVKELRSSVRRNGKNYSNWEIHLYQGNNPKWLKEQKSELIIYIKENLGFKHVKNIIIL
jgi:hypothetical protein